MNQLIVTYENVNSQNTFPLDSQNTVTENVGVALTLHIPAYMTLLRFSPIVLEFIGTVLVWLDAVRLNARNPPKAFNIGDAPGYDAWYYH